MVSAYLGKGRKLYVCLYREVYKCVGVNCASTATPTVVRWSLNLMPLICSPLFTSSTVKNYSNLSFKLNYFILLSLNYPNRVKAHFNVNIEHIVLYECGTLQLETQMFEVWKCKIWRQSRATPLSQNNCEHFSVLQMM